MRLSSGVVWRHRELDRFRAECPGGDPVLQRLLFERLDDDLRWLESLGAPVVARETGNELTTGRALRPRGADRRARRGGRRRAPVRAAARAARRPRRWSWPPAASRADRELLREHVTPEAEHVLLRAAPGSTGDGLRLGPGRGGRARVPAWARFTLARCRRRPPAWTQRDFVALSQLYARHAEVTNERGERHETATWSEVDTAQWMARQPRARAWFRVPRRGARASACASAAWGRWSRRPRRPARRCGASRVT